MIIANNSALNVLKGCYQKQHKYLCIKPFRANGKEEAC